MVTGACGSRLACESGLSVVMTVYRMYTESHGVHIVGIRVEEHTGVYTKRRSNTGGCDKNVIQRVGYRNLCINLNRFGVIMLKYCKDSTL